MKQPSYDVWDLVPGQPHLFSNLSNCDSSSGISSSSSNCANKPQPTQPTEAQLQQLKLTDHSQAPATAVETNGKWLEEVAELIENENATVATSNGGVESNSVSVVLDDPFDADWAALATRSFDRKNPFISGPDVENASGVQKTFELQM